MDKIAFIGGGNMAAAIIGRLIASGWDPSRVTLADPNAVQRGRLTSERGVHTTEDATPFGRLVVGPEKQSNGQR